jgi:hypothetical protein
VYTARGKVRNISHAAWDNVYVKHERLKLRLLAPFGRPSITLLITYVLGLYNTVLEFMVSRRHLPRIIGYEYNIDG